jgi:hypothetical protein
VNSGLQRARSECAAGRPWRAKEILQGHIAASPYSPLLYGEYGALLLKLGDALEAGKYLLLSGSNSPDHRMAISLFLERYGADPSQLHGQFPSAAKGLSIEAYPDSLRQIFASSGFTPPSRLSPPVSAKTAVSNLIAFGVGVLLLSCVVVGGIQIARWCLQLLRFNL